MRYAVIPHGRKAYIRPHPVASLANALDKYLSYQRKGAEYILRAEFRVTHLFNRHESSFPVGLLPTVKKIFDAWVKRTPGDFVEYPEPVDAVVVPVLPEYLRPYQCEAIEALFKNNGGMVCLPTGTGKTLMGVEYLRAMNVPALVVVPTTVIRGQWQSQVPSFVDVRTYQGIKPKEDLSRYKVVLYDECHHAPARTIYKLAMGLGEQVVVGLSATPWREDGEDMKLFGALGQIVYEKGLREMIDEGWLCDAEVVLCPVDDGDERFWDYQEAYSAQIVHNGDRNVVIKKRVEEYRDAKILILVGHIEHGEILAGLLTDEDVVFVQGSSKTKDFSRRVTISTSLLDEGVDLPEMQVIILAGGGASAIKVTQRIGRVLRPHVSKTKAVIVDFLDEGKWFKEHSERRRALYEEYGFKVSVASCSVVVD